MKYVTIPDLYGFRTNDTSKYSASKTYLNSASKKHRHLSVVLRANLKIIRHVGIVILFLFVIYLPAGDLNKVEVLLRFLRKIYKPWHYVKTNENCGNMVAIVPLNRSILLHLNSSCCHVDPPQPEDKNSDHNINKYGNIFKGNVKKTNSY